MRFRGTLALLVLCFGLAAFLYFYEIKGGEEREKAKEAENRLWEVGSGDIQQIDIVSTEQHVTAIRTDEKEWKITAPRSLEADSDEFDRLASSAADLQRESIVEANATDLARFGLDPAKNRLLFKTKDGVELGIRFGITNPGGNSTYAVLEGHSEVFLLANYAAEAFRKNLDDLRNHSILSFDQFDARSLELRSAEGFTQLMKEDDRWWIHGDHKWAADSSAVTTILSSLANGRLEEFFDDDTKDYGDLGFEDPMIDIRVTVGEGKELKHLTVGKEKSKLVKSPSTPSASKSGEKPEASATSNDKLYIARDESRSALFYVDQEFVDKLLKSPTDLRDKSLAIFQRWDIDAIVLTNSRGIFRFAKASGDWLLGEDKKKTNWDAVNGIFDSMAKEVKRFIDEPAPAETYGLENPSLRVTLKQGEDVKVECSFGEQTEEGVYARVAGESEIKVVEKEVLEKLDRGEADFLEESEAKESEPKPESEDSGTIEYPKP